jgi:3-oxoadipate enol-lactonase
MTDGLVLIHGWPMDGSMWDRQAASLLGRVPLVAPSLPGFGDTPSAGAVMSMDAGAEAVLASADAAGIDRFVACGLSMGGYVAFSLWRRHRERLLGLVLANTRAGPDDDAGRERRRAVAARLLSEGTGFLAGSPPPLLSSTAPEDLWTLVREIIQRQPAAAIAAAALGMAARPDSTPDLPGIDVPVLVITAGQDTLIPSEATAPIAEAVPNGSLITLPGAGHLSNLEAPEAFVDALQEHLRTCGVPVG